MEILASVDHHRLTRHERRGRATEEDGGAQHCEEDARLVDVHERGVHHAQELRLLAVEVRVGGDLVLRIRDDGKGVAPDRMSNVVGSHGIASMRHRVTSLGGQWKIQSPPGGGTLIIARLPLSNVLLKDDDVAA